MQKDFTIQVLFCIDKARYGRDKIFSSQRILEKIQQRKLISWKTMNYNHEQNI